MAAKDNSMLGSFQRQVKPRTLPNPCSVTLFVSPVTFERGDELLQPERWEKIAIPNYMVDATLNNLCPKSGLTFSQADTQCTAARETWLMSLVGYATALRISVNGCTLSAEITKDKLKR